MTVGMHSQRGGVSEKEHSAIEFPSEKGHAVVQLCIHYASRGLHCIIVLLFRCPQ